MAYIFLSIFQTTFRNLFVYGNEKKSGIKNDPNDWSEEVGNPRYILDLLLSIINVSVQTVDIVEGLPRVEFETSSN